MKKSIFLFFAAILCAMTANAYDQAAVDLYFDNSTSQWAKCFVSVGHTSWTAFYDMERVKGTQYLWKLPANFNGGNSWGGAEGWAVSVDKWDGYPKNEDITVKYVWHGDKNVTKLQTSAWVATKIYKANGTESVSKDNTTKTVYKVTSYTKANYTVTINTVTGGTLTVKDYDNNAVATGASKIHLTVLKFNATPASGYVLDAVEINDGTNTTTIAAADLATKTHTLTSNVTINPVWRATTSTVTVTATATNGSVTGGGVVEAGTSVTLTATPDAGYKFANWTVGGAEVSTANPYTFTAEADVEVVANFEELPKATIYFVNNGGWSKVQAYAWDGTKGANPGWPGADITANKLAESEKIGEYDVYSYTVEQGSYGKVIFNNGTAQTADYVWTDGNYYWHNEAANFAGGTKAQAEEKFNTPVEYDYVYLINTNDWAKAHIYTWTPEVTGWPGAAMTKEAEQIAGKDVYSYKVVKGSTFGGLIFNNGEGTQTGDLTWQAGKYYAPSTNEWYADAAAAESALAAVVNYDYYLTGSLVGGWDPKQQGIEKDGELYKATFTDLAAGEYEFKITKGVWAQQWNYSNLDKAYEEVSEGKDGEGSPNGNIKIVTTAVKTITVIFDATANKISIEGLTEIVVPTFDYYVVGEFNSWANPDPNHGMELDGAVYKATVSLKSGDNMLKVTNGTWDDGGSWGYSDLGASYEEVSDANNQNNIKITLAADKDITVIFDATTKKITFEELTVYIAPLTYNVTVPAGTEKCYIARSVTGWAFEEMTKVDDTHYTITIAGAKESDTYKYTRGEGWEYVEVKENGEGIDNRTWTANDVVAKWADVITYVLMGVNGDWTTGIELEPNPGNNDEYMLLEQNISRKTDAVKVVKLVNGEKTEYYGNLNSYSNTVPSYDNDWNLVLESGVHSFYFNVTNGEIYIFQSVYRREVTNKYGTICLPYAALTTSGARFYRVAGKGTEKGKTAVYLESVDAVEAGVPYIFEKTASTIEVVYDQEKENTTAGTANGLVGTFTNNTDVAPTTGYILYNDAFCMSDGSAKVNAYRAYLNLNDITGGAPTQMPGRRYIGMDVQGENEATGFENITAPEGQAIKTIVNGQLVIIRGGEMYNAQGQKL